MQAPMRFETEKNMPMKGIASSSAAVKPNAAHHYTHISAAPSIADYPGLGTRFEFYSHRYSFLRSVTKTATSCGVIFFDSKYGL